MSKVEIIIFTDTEHIVTKSKMLFVIIVLRCCSRLLRSKTIAKIHMSAAWTIFFGGEDEREKYVDE